MKTEYIIYIESVSNRNDIYVSVESQDGDIATFAIPMELREYKRTDTIEDEVKEKIVQVVSNYLNEDSKLFTFDTSSKRCMIVNAFPLSDSLRGNGYEPQIIFSYSPWRSNIKKALKDIESLGQQKEFIEGEWATVYYDMIIKETKAVSLKIPISRLVNDELIWDYLYLLRPVSGFIGGFEWETFTVNLIQSRGVDLSKVLNEKPLPMTGFSLLKLDSDWVKFQNQSLRVKAISNIIQSKVQVPIRDRFYNVFLKGRMARKNKTDYIEIKYSPNTEITFPNYLKVFTDKVSMQDFLHYVNFLSEKGAYDLCHLTEIEEEENFQNSGMNNIPDGYGEFKQFDEDRSKYDLVEKIYKDLKTRLDFLFTDKEWESEQEKINILKDLEPLKLFLDSLYKSVDSLLLIYEIEERKRQSLAEEIFLNNYFLAFSPTVVGEETLYRWYTPGTKYNMQFIFPYSKDTMSTIDITYKKNKINASLWDNTRNNKKEISNDVKEDVPF